MLTVVSYNIMFAIKQKEVIESFRRIGRLAETNGIHYLIGLQEVRNTERNTNIQQLVGGVFGQSHIDYFLREGISLHDLGLALISGSKPQKTLRLELPRLKGFFWNTLFKLKGGIPQYGALINEYRIDGKAITVANLHLDVFGNNEHKASQVKAVKKALEKFDTKHCIIMGDFNTKDVEFVTELFGTDFNPLGSCEKHTVSIRKAINPEIPGSRLIQKLARITGFDITFRSDWILVKNMKLRSEGVEYKCLGSDHYPLWAVLDFES